MNVEKPAEVGFGAQALAWGGKLYQSCTVTICVDLKDGTVMPLDKGMDAAVLSLGSGTCPDSGVPKGRAEWLLAGNAYAPKGTPSREFAAGVRVGASLRVFAVRSPLPITLLPLTWGNTVGTEDENPAAVASGRPSPCVTDPSLGAARPACPMPRGAWPCRTALAGTYDERWLAKNWPALAGDCDPLFFNLAQPSQFLPEGLRGNETVELTNLHPTMPAIRATLPGTSIAMTVFRPGQDGWAGSLSLDTLWLFPERMTAMLIWHGLIPSASETGKDIERIVLTVTPKLSPGKDEPEGKDKDGTEAPASEAESIAVTMTAVGSAATSQTSSSGLGMTPEADIAEQEVPLPADEGAEAGMNRLLDESLDDINKSLAEAGLPTLGAADVEKTRGMLAKYSKQLEVFEQTPEPPSIDWKDELLKMDVPKDRIDAVEKAIGIRFPDPADFGTADAWGKAVDKAVDEFASVLPLPKGQVDAMKTVMRYGGPGGDALPKAISPDIPTETLDVLTRIGGLPKDRAVAFVAALDAVMPDDMAGFKAYSKAVEKAAGFPEGSMLKHVDTFEKLMQEYGIEEPADAAVSTASGTDGAASAVTDAVGRAEADKAVEAAIGPQRGEATADAAESVPIGFRFDGVEEIADAEEFDQEREPVLDRALFDKDGHPTEEALRSALAGKDGVRTKEDVILLMLGGVSLTGLSLTGLDLSETDMSEKDLHGCDFGGCDLRGTDFSGSDLSGASFKDADLTWAILSRADLSEADLSGASAEGADLTEAKLIGASCVGLSAPDSSWNGADLTGAHLGRSDLFQADLAETVAADADFGGASLEGCGLRNAILQRASFVGASCREADFHGADATGADFSGADLGESSFSHGAHADGARFAKAVMDGAVWTDVCARKADFTRISAEKAMFTDSDLTGSVWPMARLRGADFSRSDLTSADLRGIDLFGGSGRETVFNSADLKEASLYGADLCRAYGDAATNVEGTDLTNTIWAIRGGIPHAQE